MIGKERFVQGELQEKELNVVLSDVESDVESDVKCDVEQEQK